MKKTVLRFWKYKGFTILKEKTFSGFSYVVYDDTGFALEAFGNFNDCKKFIDEKN